MDDNDKLFDDLFKLEKEALKNLKDMDAHRISVAECKAKNRKIDRKRKAVRAALRKTKQ